MRNTWSVSPSVITLGLAYHRSHERVFGIRVPDLLQHLFVLGQTGTGKSTLLQQIATDAARQGIGICLIDPHGDLAVEGRDRLTSDHLYWDVSDPDSPLGYNPLTRVSEPLRPLVASGLIETLKKQWEDAWGVRMEHLLRYALLALQTRPDTDLRDILRLYLDRGFRKEVVAGLTDPQVLDFWQKEFPAMNYKNTLDGVAPIANKLGALLAHPVVRRALCEPREPLRFRKLMDDSRVLIVNLAKGKIGADIANVVGGLLVSSLLRAAYTRHDLPKHARRPFLLLVDEHHSFTSAAVADGLAEARKMGLGLVLAGQHTGQSDASVLDAIFGNVGSLMCFRLGAQDAPLLAKQLQSVEPRDLINLPDYHSFTRLMVDGEKTRSFSARTVP